LVEGKFLSIKIDEMFFSICLINLKTLNEVTEKPLEINQNRLLSFVEFKFAIKTETEKAIEKNQI
jgi:hypothetical protein